MFILSLLKTIESIVLLEFAAQMLQGMLKGILKKLIVLVMKMNVKCFWSYV